MIKNLFYLGILLSIISCSAPRRTVIGKGDGKIQVVFVQVNDVYEIAPLSAGREGGMARVASLKKELLARNPNTLLIMAGDFLSPSVYNSLIHEKQRVRGKQMIDAMNIAGTDLAVFGNHEFDITESELQARINESRFDWVSTNTFQLADGKPVPFKKYYPDSSVQEIPRYKIMSFTDPDGTVARIAIIGITLPFNRAEYVNYTDPLIAAKETFTLLRDSVDAVVAITHQKISDDIILAQQVPGLAVILGGHEHDMRIEKVDNVYITKAHANARSAYVVQLDIDVAAKKFTATPVLRMLDESVPLDPATTTVVNKWMDVADSSYGAIGFNARQVVLQNGDSLDGREIHIRNRPTNFTELIMKSMSAASPTSELAMMNSGSIRLDDILYAPVTQYDIIRSLPYGGSIREVEMSGSLLQQVFEAGKVNKGLGGYLLYDKVQYNDQNKQWLINGEGIDSSRAYRVAISEFLFSGKEENLNFLNNKNPGVIREYPEIQSSSNPLSDIRLAIVRYLASSAK